MKVSIILPVYNLQTYISETIESIVNQTYKNWECIVIDDGSSDRSADIIKAVIAMNPQIRLIQTENRGVSSARNTGLRNITGDYVYFVDGDDPLPVDALMSLTISAKNHKADIVIGKMMHKYNGVLRNIPTYEKYGVYNEGEKTLENNPEILHSIGPTAKLFHKDVIKGLQFPTHLKFAEEHPFIVQAYQNSRKIYVVNKLVYNYIIRDEEDSMSTTQQLDTRTYEFIKDLIESHMLVFNLMRNKSGRKVQQYYYYRITEYIMWPLLKFAVQSNNFDPYAKLLMQYFSSQAHQKMLDVKTFKRVYIAYCMREVKFLFYKNQSHYFNEVLQYISKNCIDVFVFKGNPTKLKYIIYNFAQKFSYLLKRIAAKLQRLMRK